MVRALDKECICANLHGTTMGGEYTASWKDVDSILRNVQPVVSSEDYGHIKRILAT